MDQVILKVKRRLNSLTKEQLVGLSIAIVFLMIGAVYFALVGIDGKSGQGSKIEPGSVEQPLPYSSDKKIVIDLEDKEVTEEIKYEELPVYQIVKENHYNTVQNFMSDIGMGFATKENYDDIVYYWKEGENTSFYITEYNSVLDKVFFRFETAKSPRSLNVSSVRQEELGNFFQKFAQQYWGRDYKYQNFKVSFEGRNYKIEANRLIGDIPLYISGINTYSDYLVVTSEGKIVEGEFHLFDYDAESGEVLDLVQPDLLASVISRDDYPKEFNQLQPIGFDFSKYGAQEQEYDESGQFLGDLSITDYSEIIPEVKQCNASKVTLVYLFVNNNSQYITPTYRIDCMGEVIVDKEEYDVPVIIYTSAIDPEYVYVPSDVDNN